MVSKHCNYCSKEFSVHSYRIETAKYCSRLCANIAVAQRQAKQAQFNCLACDKVVSTSPSQFRYAKTCSRRCLSDYKKGKPSYLRTDEHKQKMSIVISSLDLSRQAKMFAKIGSSKKGKTYEEIWGEEKALEIKSKLSKPGKANPNWKDGRSLNGYLNFGRALKRRIKERDGHKCLWCGITDEEERSRDSLGRGLAIHHIDHDRGNSSERNLATLCKSCNSLEVKRQSEWQPKLEEIVYGYYA